LVSGVHSRFHPFAIGALFVGSLASNASGSEPAPRDRAQALLAELDKQGAASGAAKDAVAESRRALGRADKARLAGDQKHGAELESLALEWAEAGRELMRAAAAERRATELEKKLTEAEVKLRTTRTLIEQAAARRARADAELAELKKGPEAAAAPLATGPKSATSAAPPKAAAPPKTAPSPAPAGPAKPKEPK
jgi:hypothetical protein